MIILNFNRVEKSLWNSSSLRPDAIAEQLVLGLEQSKDTVMPEIIIKKGFKPFVEDELPGLIKGTQALVAHPEIRGQRPILNSEHVDQNRALSPNLASGPITLIIGPEGGIIDYEIAQLRSAGCQLIDLGPRILRTEAVLPFVVGKLF